MNNSPTTMTVLRTSNIQEHSTYRALRPDLVHLVSDGIYTLYCSRHKGNAYILLIDDIRLCDAEQDFDDDRCDASEFDIY